MTLYRLFKLCISIPYKKIGVASNYATQKSGNTLYIFFQASEEATDWKNNLNFPAKAYERMGKRIWFAHRGFLKAWKEIEPYLVPEISNPSVKKIVITGYSHGGALAMLCHEFVWFNRPDLRESTDSYGFGAPRVFWGIRTPQLKERWKRFTVIRNIDDIVTHLPPALLGYSHMGKMLEIGEKGKYGKINAHLPQNILNELKIAGI